MSTSTIWIVVAVAVAAVVIVALLLAARSAARRRRQRQAEQIREQARVETAQVERRQALADETAAKARAAQAEAEAKAAEAARLQERAATHHSEVANSREQLQERLKHADSIDPTAQTRDASDRPEQGRDEAWSEEAPVRQDDVQTDNLRDAGNYRAPSS
jgi:flagellar biosynthesis/type III secretory pathway M-ring protein FliF/YscJ